MAAMTSFKQQCPSCEAMVPIRDSNLIGRKIDCPKCKYRFVVEEPAPAEDADDEEPKAGKKGGKDAKAKGGRRRDEDDDEGGGKAAAKKSGGSTKLIMGIVGGVVAVVVLGVVGYYLFSGGDSSPKSGGPMAGGPPSGGAPSAPPKEEDKPESKPSGSSSDYLTNLLPPETEGVSHIRMKDLFKTALGRTAFDTPGAFNVKSLQQRLGISVSDIDNLVQGWNFSKNWSFTVVHTTEPYSPDAVKTALQAKPVPEKEKIEDQEWFILAANSWREQMGKQGFATLFQMNPTHVPASTGPLALRFHDAQTLILANVEPMKEFLTAKGVFKTKSQAGEPAPKEEEKEKPQQQAGGMMGMMPGMGGPGRPPGGGGPSMMPNMPGGGGPSMMPNMPGGGGPPGSGPQAGRPGMPGMPGAGAAANTPSEAEPTITPSAGYLTIDPSLKTMMDRLDSKQPVVSLALDTQPAYRHVPQLSHTVAGISEFIREGRIFGLSLQMKDGLLFTFASDAVLEDQAIKRKESLEKERGLALAALLTKLLEAPVDLAKDEPPTQPGAFPGRPGAPGFPGMMGMMPPGAGGRPGAGARPGGGGGRLGRGERDDAVPGGGGGQPRLPQGQGMPPGMMPGMPQGMMPGFPGAPGQPGANPPAEEKEKPPTSSVKVAIQDKTIVVLTVNLIDQAAQNLLNKVVRNYVIRQKGYLDMASGQSRIHELAAAARAYAEGHQGFPQGAAPRTIPSSRAGRPYPPDQRVSWMVELLPYLGPDQAALHTRVNREKSWRDLENLESAATLIPQFLDPHYSQDTWWVRYPGMLQAVASTHFVGISGVGLDAAEYSADDPATANKRGIFNYDHPTRLSEIKDSKSATILMAQVPPTFKRPWLAGGGSTVQGVPEKDSVQPFVSTDHDGKRGTLLIMADGSVRFVTDKISDEVFKGMATINGGEPPPSTRESPIIPLPEDRAAIPTAPAAPAGKATK